MPLKASGLRLDRDRLQVVIGVHPFYGSSDRLLSTPGWRGAGLASMAAYLGFWTLALVVAKRELDQRWPKAGRPDHPDPAMAVLRERFARGELDAAQFRAMADVLDQTSGAGR